MSTRPVASQLKGFVRNVVLLTAFAGTIAILFSGCRNVVRRGQSPDESLLKFSNDADTNFIGKVCGVRGLRPAQIEGIGLVVGLDSTGSNPKPSGQKDYLLRELKINSTTDNAKSALKSKNTSMVMIRGLIPPGARIGDIIDLEVIAPPNSDTTSLKYGELLKTDMRPMSPVTRSVKLGNVQGKAKGRVLVDGLFESSTDDSHLLRGRILGGGVVKADRDLTLVVHSENTSVKVTRSIAHSINQRYNKISKDGRDDVAKPVTDRIIQLAVPHEYQHNLGRFIQSLQAMAYSETQEERASRLKDLDRRLSDATTAKRAAIELEAIGADSEPILREAIQHPDFEVRFYVAETMAYMGFADGVPHLKQAAESEPAFRWHALTALASIDSNVAVQALKSLLDLPSAETRYGAFRALQACCPDDSRISGKLLGDEFYFHDVSTDADGMVHFARTRKPEIVVFGNDHVADDFLFVEAGLTVKAIDDSRARVIRFDPIDGETRFTCSSSISELIKTLARFGVDYTTLLELCREADANDTLNSRLVINAAPRIGSKSMDDSVGSNSRDSTERSERYISHPVPNLFSDVQQEASPQDELEQ